MLYIRSLLVIAAFLISVFSIPKAFAQATSVCQDISTCTAEGIPEQIGTSGFCKQYKQEYRCGAAFCHIEYSTQCTTPQPVNICNAPFSSTNFSSVNRNCKTWCEGNVPANTLNRDARIQDCIQNSCRDAKGNVTSGTGGDYVCPNNCNSSNQNNCQICSDQTQGCITYTATALTCTGTASDGQPISCQAGSSCASGYQAESGKTCSSGNVCCKQLPTCQCPTQNTKSCNTAIGPTNPTCVGEGGQINFCPSGNLCDPNFSCTTSGCVRTTTNCSWTSCSNNVCGGIKREVCGTTLSGRQEKCSPDCPPAAGSCSTSISNVGNTNATGTATGDMGGYDRADWYILPDSGGKTFLGTNQSTSTNFTATANGLLSNKGYQMYATLWSSTNSRQPVECSHVHFTTSQPPAVTSDLQCWGAPNLQFGEVARWASGTGTGQKYDPNMNLPGSSNHKVGEGCYRPGSPPEEPTPGKVAGRVWLKDTATSTPRLITSYSELSQIANPLQMWLYSPSAPCPPFSSNCRCVNGFIQADNGGYICQFDPTYCLDSNTCNGWGFDNNYFSYVFSSNDKGFIAQENPSMAEYVQVYYFPLGHKLVGYYSYQERVANTTQFCTYCNSDCSTDPNNYTCTEDGGCGKGSYCGNYDTIESNIQCERTPAKFHPVNPNNVVRGQIYTLTRVECQPDAPPFSLGAVYDLVFEKEAKYQVSGTIFIDDNKNAVQDNGEGGFNGALLALAGPASNFSMTSGAGGIFSLTSLDRGNYTLSLTVPGGYLATTPASSSFVLSQDTVINFGITPNNTVSGKVVLDVNNDLCSGGTSGPGYAGVSITIIPTSGGSQRTTQSSGSGLYSITGLPNGNFSIQATPTTNRQILSPANAQYVTTLPNAGPFDFCISQIAPWIQTEGASVHGRRIDIPGGP